MPNVERLSAQLSPCIMPRMNSRQGRRFSMPARFAAALLSCVVAAMAIATAQGGAGRANARNNPDEKEWIQLFNGRDLADWSPKFAHHELGENFNDTFRVEDGLLKVRYDKWPTFTDEFGHIFYQRAVLVLHARGGVPVCRRAGQDGQRTDLAWAIRNNGLMIHSPRPKR